MRRRIEYAVREQLALLDARQRTAVECRRAILQLASASEEAGWLVSEVVAQLRHSAPLSEEAARVIAGCVALPADGVTVDLPCAAGDSGCANPESAHGLAVGRVLRGRYVILGSLGAGGKGTVFRALDRYRSALLDAEHHVALKVLHSVRDGADRSLKELALELHCGQMLSHRNIVKVFELDRDEDVVFYTMELLEGELLSSLIERMRPSTLDRSQAWHLIRQLGAGLQHAHERAVLHGDLKPRNILVTREGELRILDFGAAKTMVGVAAHPGQPEVAPLSGTPAYASCELLEGRAVDRRDDVYALACICYELLTGAHPFAYRPATLARNFGVKAARPAGLSHRQWGVMQAGLSWHRAGRSMSVQAWIEKLTRGIAAQPAMTPLRDLVPARAARSDWPAHLVAACVGVAVIGGLSLGGLGTARKIPEIAAAHAASEFSALAPAPAAPGRQPLAPESPAPDPPAVDGAEPRAATHPRPSAPPSAAIISVDGYRESAGDRFVEIRVHRNRLQKNGSFVWWTEPATARQNVDFVQQGKAVQTFAAGRRSTRFYVKLLPQAAGAQRDYFYVAIAQPALDRRPGAVTRAQIWLRAARDQWQARR